MVLAHHGDLATLEPTMRCSPLDPSKLGQLVRVPLTGGEGRASHARVLVAEALLLVDLVLHLEQWWAMEWRGGRS